MKVYRFQRGIAVEKGRRFYLFNNRNWDEFVNRDDLYAFLEKETEGAEPIPDAVELLDKELLAPAQSQEIWASGVTYYRSREARMEEAKDAGGGDFYDRVYAADRPELFFKSPAYRAVPSGGRVRIRKDSTWNVPEPELTLFMTSGGKIVGYTIGNDMSSRSIEGENPLYLPQAKTYDGSAALGPCLYVPGKPLPPETLITLEILRKGQSVFSDSIPISQMKRGHEELAGFLFSELSFPHGCYLMTGTGIIPPNEFTLQSGDTVRIGIEGIGWLVNEVE